MAGHGEKRSFLISTMGGIEYAIPTSQIREIVHIPELLRPIGLPDVLHGFLNFEQQLLPVIRLDVLFEIDSIEINLFSPIVLLRPDIADFCLLFDTVERVVEINTDFLIAANPEHTFNGCIEAQINQQNGAIFLLRLDRILTEKETRSIRDFSEQSVRRMTRMPLPPERLSP